MKHLLAQKSGKRNFFSIFSKAKNKAKNISKKYSGGLPQFLLGEMYQSYFTTPGEPVWTPRNYLKFSDEGYSRNVIAFRSINLIAQSAASVPWLLYNNENGVKKEIPSHPVLDLLSQPNPGMGGNEFIENLFTYRMISGNAYIQRIVGQDGAPGELYLLRPDRMTVIAGKNYLPQAYRYTVSDVYKDFPVNRISGQSDILHLKNFHPLNDWYGLSPVEAAAYSIDQHNQAAIWNQSLLQNGARPSGALIVKNSDNQPTTLNDDQFQRLKNQIDDQYAGAMNSGRPLLLEGGLEWKEMSLKPRDMDFLNTKYSSARDIALAFGVPPQLLGIPGDSTYNNLGEAKLSLWEQTILPMLQNLANALNGWLMPLYGPNLCLEFDLDEISTLAAQRENLWAKLQSIDFMTINEKRHAVGLSPITGGDTPPGN